jgi:hypothetical protein
MPDALHPSSLRRMPKVRFYPQCSRVLHLELFTKPLENAGKEKEDGQ